MASTFVHAPWIIDSHLLLESAETANSAAFNLGIYLDYSNSRQNFFPSVAPTCFVQIYAHARYKSDQPVLHSGHFHQASRGHEA